MSDTSRTSSGRFRSGRATNTVLTPHLGFTTVEVLNVFYQHAIDNILAFLDGKPKNVANPDALKK